MAKQRRTSRPIAQSRHGQVERTAAVLDVQLLDLVAEIEALLRSGREIQRHALRVRGVPVASTPSQRTAAATKIRLITESMMKDQQTMVKVLAALRKSARQLDARLRVTEES
jgi:hypothetical protein